MIQPWLAELLVCPRCRSRVQLDEAREGLICESCNVLYPIRDGIPQMLPESAVPLGGGDGQGRR